MKPAMSERWARFILRTRDPWGSWTPPVLLFTCLLLVVTLTQTLTRVDGPPWLVCLYTFNAALTGMGAFVMWERLGVRRVIEAKDAEIRRLRGETHPT
jgi:hypothetical protein